MPIQSTLAQVGFAKQSAKGTAVTTGFASIGLTGGSVLSTDISQELENRTSGQRMALGINRTAAMFGMDFTCRAHPVTTGMILMGLLGTDTKSGASAPYSHAFSLASTLPYLTAYAKLGSDNFTIKDFVVDEVTFSWDGNNPVEMSVKGMGAELNNTTAPTIADDETVNSTYLTPVGGTFQAAMSGAAATAKITGGSITIKNNMEAILVSGAITPDDFMPAEFSVECSLDITPNNLNEWRTFATGSTSGATLASTPPIGAFNIVFDNKATNGGTTSSTLTLAHSKVAFATDFPDADPSGGPVTISLAGVTYSVSNSSTGLTATLTNSQSAAY